MMLWYLAFCYAISFYIQLWIATVAFSPKMEKRRGFAKRAFLGSLFVILLGSLTYQILCHGKTWFVTNTAFYFLMAAYVVIAVRIIYQVNFLEAFDVTLTGYMVQNLSSQISQIFISNKTIAMRSIWNMVERESTRSMLTMATAFFGTLPLIFAGYLILYIPFHPKKDMRTYTRRTRQKMAGISLISLIVVVFLSSYRDSHAGESLSLMIASRLLSIMCYLLLLIMKSSILELNAAEQEKALLQQLRVEERKQYEQKKETVELINVKCHDMRHQIDLLEKRGKGMDPQELDKMRELINIYDSSVQTGNETLDILLTERSLYCEKYGIRLSCIVDGSKLDFMSVSDICSLFGNALENAIRAVEILEDPEERIISLKVQEKNGMLLIRVDNSFRGNLVFDGDLPQTTKKKDGYHGYGLKSIQMVAKKYAGVMRIQTDEQFVLTVMIPIP